MRNTLKILLLPFLFIALFSCEKDNGKTMSKDSFDETREVNSRDITGTWRLVSKNRADCDGNIVEVEDLNSCLDQNESIIFYDDGSYREHVYKYDEETQPLNDCKIDRVLIGTWNLNEEKHIGVSYKRDNGGSALKTYTFIRFRDENTMLYGESSCRGNASFYNYTIAERIR